MPAGPDATIVGYHGEVSVDPESNAILRQTLIGELPSGFRITECSSWVEYDYRPVAGNNYLLPVGSQTKLASGRYHVCSCRAGLQSCLEE